MVAEYAYILDVAENLPEMKLRVIAKSAPALNVPLLVRSSRYPEKGNALQKLIMALQEIRRNPEARTLLQLFKIERLVAIDEENSQPVSGGIRSVK